MEILTNFEKRLKDYETFEKAILIHIEKNYFPFVFQCVQFQKAANDFVKKHADYFEKFYESESIKIELEKRHMTHYFPKMEIVDMALYESIN